jgi:Ca2+-binding EF-hand superfamily protein
MTERGDAYDMGSVQMGPVQMEVTEETQGETKGECQKEIKERIIGHIFDLLDADKSGVLDKTEVGDTLASWGLKRFKGEEKKDDVLEEFWAFDEDGDGTLSRAEFHNMWKKKKVDFLERVEARLVKLMG